MAPGTQLISGLRKRRTAGKILGVLVGIGGLLVSGAMLFVPVHWAVGSGVAARMSGIDYLFGTQTAEPIFYRATFIALISLSLIYIIKSEGIRFLWLITGIIAVAGIGGLMYGENIGKVLISVAVLLSLSAGIMTAERKE